MASEIPKNRVVQLTGFINDECAHSVIAHLLFHHMEDPESPVFLRIDSFGGSVTASLAILDTMRFVNCPVTTECRGIAYGCAAVIFAAGSPGMRRATRDAAFGFTRTVLGEETQDMRATAAHLAQLHERLILELSRTCRQKPSRIAEDMDVERQFTATEAIQYGLADEEIS
ncbi:MAG: ATP-dependent Clp protease proteolytic subunit [Verrucomicrobiaceae bacterium]|nr:MAG: ATP-dependent Clp protease proteolytic subunit [Verrucomicrobiaceae bacterium]